MQTGLRSEVRITCTSPRVAQLAECVSFFGSSGASVSHFMWQFEMRTSMHIAGLARCLLRAHEFFVECVLTREDALLWRLCEASEICETWGVVHVEAFHAVLRRLWVFGLSHKKLPEIPRITTDAECADFGSLLMWWHDVCDLCPEILRSEMFSTFLRERMIVPSDGVWAFLPPEVHLRMLTVIATCAGHACRVYALERESGKSSAISRLGASISRLGSSITNCLRPSEDVSAKQLSPPELSSFALDCVAKQISPFCATALRSAVQSNTRSRFRKTGKLTSDQRASPSLGFVPTAILVDGTPSTTEARSRSGTPTPSALWGEASDSLRTRSEHGLGSELGQGSKVGQRSQAGQRSISDYSSGPTPLKSLLKDVEAQKHLLMWLLTVNGASFQRRSDDKKLGPSRVKTQSCGTIPTRKEVRRFLDSRAPELALVYGFICVANIQYSITDLSE